MLINSRSLILTLKEITDLKIARFRGYQLILKGAIDRSAF